MKYFIFILSLLLYGCSHITSIQAFKADGSQISDFKLNLCRQTKHDYLFNYSNTVECEEWRSIGGTIANVELINGQYGVLETPDNRELALVIQGGSARFGTIPSGIKNPYSHVLNNQNSRSVPIENKGVLKLILND